MGAVNTVTGEIIADCLGTALAQALVVVDRAAWIGVGHDGHIASRLGQLGGQLGELSVFRHIVTVIIEEVDHDGNIIDSRSGGSGGTWR